MVDDQRSCKVMTPQEINEAVARKLGWTRIDECCPGHSYGFGLPPGKVFDGEYIAPRDGEDIPSYCESIEAAWEIVDHCIKKGFFILITYSPTRGWHCGINLMDGSADITSEPFIPNKTFQDRSDQSPMAICLAFLKLP